MGTRKMTGLWSPRGSDAHRHLHHHQHWEPRLPQASGNFLPEWEKRFITDACCIPLKRYFEVKKYLELGMHRDIQSWDDSGALQAFKECKARYCAEINGFPFNIPLPVQDLYLTTNIDYDAPLDPDLLAEFEMPLPQPPEPDPDIWNKPIVPTGWGDEPSQSSTPPPAPAPTGWGDEPSHSPSSRAIVPTGWGDEPSKSSTPPPAPAPTGWGDEPSHSPPSHAIVPTGWGDEPSPSPSPSPAPAWAPTGWMDGPSPSSAWDANNNWENNGDHCNTNYGWEDHSWQVSRNRNTNKNYYHEIDPRHGRKRNQGGGGSNSFWSNRKRNLAGGGNRYEQLV